MIEAHWNTEALPIIIVPSVQTVLLRPGNNDMEIFLGLRSTKSHHLQWAPPGGKVDPGETDKRAGVRELEEEAGVRIGEDQLIYFKDMPMGPSSQGNGNEARYYNAVRVFLVDAQGLSPFNALPREHVEMKWMGLKKAFDMHERIVASRPDANDRHSVPGALTQGTYKTVGWLIGR